jgi:hypothetical protein
MMAGGIYNEKGEMWHILRLHPTCNFCRIIYILSDQCAWSDCLIHLSTTPEEIIANLIWLYVNSIIYLILALYCN